MVSLLQRGPSASKHVLKLLDLQRILPQECVLGVLIDLGLVLDEFGPGGVVQCAQGLVVVVVRGTDIREHNGLCVASQ